MNFTHKFDVDDMVWYMSRDFIFNNCDLCDHGTIVIKEENFRCPKCRGNMKGTYKINFSSAYAKIYCVRIQKFSDDIFLEYEVYRANNEDETFTYEEDELFSTEEEAQAACEVKNKEI